ncbi:MAG: CotH kinase family protein [Verrucomicrobiota bacterium]|nr:CotH kinase family protein [Verrucomicrobiota bacterium]
MTSRHFYPLICAISFVFPLITNTSPCHAAGPSLMISEFMSANDSGLKDEDGEYSDWIELHNPGPESIELGEYALTDEVDKPFKWKIPELSLEPKAYLLIFASGQNRRESEQTLHTNFKLDIGGEYLALTRTTEPLTVMHAYAPRYPKQKKDVSYGVAASWTIDQPFGESEQFLEHSTPGEKNAQPLRGNVKSVRLSHKRGFYQEAFRLVLTSSTEDADIRFTTDGSLPNQQASTPYTQPIAISKTTILRMAAFKEGHRPSKTKTHSYFFAKDIIRQSPDGLPPEGFPYTWGQNQVDYGMDPDVVNDPRYADAIIPGLLSLPSFSLVTDMDSMFGEENGIYSNPGEQGRAWERAASLEMMDPSGEQKGFQVDCGFRVRGGFSRMPLNPKHALRIFFRDVYGPSKLKYPLFGKKGAKAFDNIDLRTFQNYSWSFQQDPRALFFRDQLSRDLHSAMGQPASRGEFIHLYINGHYWGLYNTCERIEASYGASYLDGKKSDYDAVKVDSGFTTRRSSYTVIATDGNLDAWNRLYDKAAAGLENNAPYFALQGRNPDGTPNSQFETLLDVDNLISYMLVIFWGGNLDAPITKFGGNRGPNNWHGIRNRNGKHGFQFFVWDAEHTLLDVHEDRTGPFNTGASVAYSSPQWLWQQCLENAEFRLRVADHVYAHFNQDGVLSEASLRESILRRALEIETAVVAESARWGDVPHGFQAGPPRRVDDAGNTLKGPLNRDDDWRKELKRILEDYLPTRNQVVLAQLYPHGVVSDLTPPRIQRSGSLIEMKSSPGETIFFTTDGSDPRAVGGQVSPEALEYHAPMRPERHKHVIKVRSRIQDEWSPLTETKR